jgi:hypothetical protein
MTTATETGLVLRDEHGAYYLLTTEQLAAARVTSEQAATLEEAIGDVTGYLTPIPIPDARFGSLSLLGVAQFHGALTSFQLNSLKTFSPKGGGG